MILIGSDKWLELVCEIAPVTKIVEAVL